MSSSSHRDDCVQLNQLLEDATKRLLAADIDTCRLDSELLLAHAAGVSREALLTRSVLVDHAAHTRYMRLIDLRTSRMPLAYILGYREFYSLIFNLSREVLIPRPDTETVVDAALESLLPRPSAKVLDLGTGSGAIALTIAANTRQVHVTATDISAKALEVAQCNALRHGLGDRVAFRLADCWEILDNGDPLGRYDLIVSNPPYICDHEIDSLAPEIRNYEPRLALAGGLDGLDFYRLIAADAGDHLITGGSVIVEVGEGQATDVAAIFRASAFSDIVILNDLAGIQRVVIARNIPPG